MDTIDVNYRHPGHIDLPGHTDLARVIDELRGALIAIGAEAPGLDEPITAVRHSFGSDGKTLFVHVDLPNGVSRAYSFTPGLPVTIADHD